MTPGEAKGVCDHEHRNFLAILVARREIERALSATSPRLARRAELVKQLHDNEIEMVRCKQRLRDADEQHRTLVSESGEASQRLIKENEDLRRELREAQTTIERQKRQMDILIRQLNAVPASQRGAA